jgi:hypothetical protein
MAGGRKLDDYSPIVEEDWFSAVGAWRSVTSGLPTGWSAQVAGVGFGVAQDSAVAYTGTKSLKLSSDGSEDFGGSAEAWITFACVSGKAYRAAGNYRIDTLKPDATLRLLVGSSGAWLLADGRNVGNPGGALLDTRFPAEWRRFEFDFIAPAASVTLKFRLETGSGIAVAINLDSVQVRHVWRVNYYAPRISATTLPESEVGSNDVFFGGKSIGVGQIVFNVSDGRYDRVLGDLEWVNAEVRVRAGGKFLDGQALTIDDYRRSFTGYVQSVEAGDDVATLGLEDARNFFHTKLPQNDYSNTEFAELDPVYQAKPKPLWFGAKGNITPVGIAKDGTTLLRTYELCDTADAPNGIKAIDTVYAYLDNDAAETEDSARRITLAAGTDYTADLATARFAIVKNPGPFEIRAEQSRLDFSIGAAPLVATLTAGLYTSAGLATMIQAALRETVGGGDTTMLCTYSDSLRKFTISRSSGDVRVLHATGINKALCPWDTLGFRRDFVYLDFDIGAAMLSAKVAPSGGQDGTALASSIQTALRGAVGGGDTTMLCSWTGGGTNKFTISRSSGTLSLRIGSGPNKALSAYPALGFNGVSDRTGSGSYLADVAVAPEPSTNVVRMGDRTGLGSYAADTEVLTDPDVQHILRVAGRGYKDDASGTYTGSANALIEVGADVCRCLLRRWFKKTVSAIDSASFLFARARAPETLAIYLQSSISTKEIFETLEFSNIANITIDGGGVVYYEVYVGDTPATVVDLDNNDFLSFRGGKSVADVYSVIRVLHDQDPTTGEFEGRSFSDPAPGTLFGRPDLREFETYIKLAGNAQAAANRMGILANAPARQIAVTVKGKLIDHRIGQKVRVTRDRAMDSDGALVGKLFRIIALKQSHQAMQTSAILVDDVVTVAGYLCVSSCQSFCEASCQESCEAACQTTCESECQSSCEVACEEVCQSECQVVCMVMCQATCEVSCQQACLSACQTACQTACQGGCQTGCLSSCETSCQIGCQVACQTGCETACQTACESSCKSACQVGCQDSCQAACQTGCQVACQTGCQVSCQDSCQTLCMTGCEVSCQSACLTTCQAQVELEEP